MLAVVVIVECPSQCWISLRSTPLLYIVIKIVERSRSLKSKNYFWLYQIKDGIGEILKFGHRGIEDYLQIRRHQPYKQLKLNV